MNGFYWYTSIGVVFVIIYWLSQFHLISLFLFQNLNQISVIFHFSFLSMFIFRVIPNSKISKYLKFVFIFFLILLVYFVINDIIALNIISHVVANSGLFIFCILYYYQLFRNIPTMNLLEEPSFWIICGIFFGMSINIPISAFGEYLFDNLPRKIYMSIALIGIFSYGIMHLFFIKAFLCIVHPQKQ